MSMSVQLMRRLRRKCWISLPMRQRKSARSFQPFLARRKNDPAGELQMSEAHALQSAGELPVDYRSALDAQSVLPAWTLLRALMPVGGAAPLALAHLWRYSQLRPLLLRAAELTPIEKAERRVLGYVNPGLHKDRLATLPSIFFGLQLIMPGERAPNHKHIPAAARIVIEGEGAYTSVNGEKLRMEAGDLVLTPPLHWHDHGHEGSAPVIWMDVLDHPLAVPLDVSYVLPGEMAKSHNERPDSGDTWCSCPGLVPYQNAPSPAPYPLLRFKFSRVRETLRAIAEAAERSEKIHLRYCNPQTGESVLKTLEFSARLLRPGETIQLPRSSANHMF
ncbi:MAG: cupin domain-containing protein, partial [Alphaproteobacteria bacterium]|nr:cupin domain-containing protein [Alphaproteobacteria bacterium]